MNPSALVFGTALSRRPLPVRRVLRYLPGGRAVVVVPVGTGEGALTVPTRLVQLHGGAQ